MKRFCLLAIGALLLLAAPAALADDKQLIVMVQTRPAPAAEVGQRGAGIVVANDGSEATIVTAAHVLQLAGVDTPNVAVAFRDAPATEVAAAVQFVDKDLDLAVLTVRSNRAGQLAFEAERNILTPAAVPLRIGDRVLSVGNPGGENWGGNTRPEPLVSLHDPLDPRRILFDSSVATGGMSGGGLFSEHGALIGMVLRASVSDTALGIETIRDALLRNDLAFGLRENPDVARSVAATIVASFGPDPVGDLSAALSTYPLDFERLHLYWLSRQPGDVFERALSAKAGRTEVTIAEQLFDQTKRMTQCRLPSSKPGDPEAFVGTVVAYGANSQLAADRLSDCAAHLRLWLRMAVESGLNPDLVVSATKTAASNGRHSLLRIALSKRNVDAAVTLLEAGATANPYEDLEGHGNLWPVYVFPLRFVLQAFTGLEQDRLWDAMTEAGVITIERVDNAGARKYPLAQDGDRTPNAALCARLQKRDNFDWCQLVDRLPNSINLDLRSSEPGGVVKLHALLSADSQNAYVVGTMPMTGEQDPVVLRISRDLRTVTGYWYSHRYGCQPNPDKSGYDLDSCWRSYPGALASFAAPAASTKGSPKPAAAAETSAAKFVPPDVSNTIVGKGQVEGISLGTALPDALRMLQSRGFKAVTVGDPLAPGLQNSSLTIVYRKPLERPATGTFEVTLLSHNNEIFAIYAQSLVKPDDKPRWVVSPTQKLTNEIYRQSDQFTSLWLSHPIDVLVLVEGAPGGRVSLVQREHTANGEFASALLLRRNDVESEAERAFIEGKLRDWLPEAEITAEKRCIDDLRHVWQRRDMECQTIAERAASFLAENGARKLIKTGDKGVQYEVLEEGKGDLLKARRSVSLTITSWKLDETGDRPTNRPTVVVGGAEGAEGSAYKLVIGYLPQMRIGSTWRFYVPPAAYDNKFSGGLKSVEIIELTASYYTSSTP